MGAIIKIYPMLQIPEVFVFNIVARKSFPNGILAVFGERNASVTLLGHTL